MNNMPPVVKNLLIINVLMYLATVVLQRYGLDLEALLGLHFFLASDFRVYQFFTYMFMHANLSHLFFNMFAVWMFGRIMEQVFGSQRFLFFYIVCGLGAGLIQEGAQGVKYLWEGLAQYQNANIDGVIMPMREYLNYWNTVGASGAIYGILLAYGMTFPNERLFIIPFPFPIKAKWLVMGYAVIELMSAFASTGDHVAHMAHLGGMLFGWLLILYWRRGSGRGNRFFGGGHSGGYDGYGNYFTPYEDVTNQPERKSLRTRWNEYRKRRAQAKTKKRVNPDASKHGDDMAWNYRKQEREHEVDRILEKIKKGGYESLTDEEKRKLFDASK